MNSFNSGWCIYNNSGGKTKIAVPGKCDTTKGELLKIYNSIPEGEAEGNVLAFFSTHQFVNVYIDDQLIYSFGLEDKDVTLSPGSMWNFIHLKKEYENKQICIELMSNYKQNSGRISNMYIGTADYVKEKIILDKIPDIVLTLFTLIIGSALLILSILLKNRYYIKDNLVYISLFAIFISLWMLIDTNVMNIYITNRHAVSMAAFMLLALLIFPFMEYFRHSFEMIKIDDGIFKGLSSGSTLLTIVIFILHVSETLEFKQTLKAVHVYMLVCIVTVIIFGIRRIKCGIKISKVKILLHLITTFIVLTPILIDLYIYNFEYNTTQKIGTGTTSLGTKFTVLFVVLILSYDSFKNSLKLIKNGIKYDDIKEIAFHDQLTKCKNRAAFDDKIENINRSDYSQYALLMMDLNNLKYFNDIYGHEMGDMYLISSTKVITDIFGIYGELYRIGGDEFSMIIPVIGDICCKNLEIILSKKIEQFNCAAYDKKMGVSIGYAAFNECIDADLYATLARADALMYENKKISKEKE